MIYVILPVFNEESNLENIIRQIREVFKNRKYQIVAVNDGSGDSSLEILNRYASQNISVITTKINMNIGAVFSSGISYVLDHGSLCDYAVIMESDNTSSCEALKKIVDKLEKSDADAVIASRYIRGGGYRNFPIKRRIMSYGANLLLSYFFPIPKVKDYTIFFRGYSVRILKNAEKYYGRHGLMQTRGFTANAELLIKLSFLTDKIDEIPFIYDYGRKKGKSKIRILSTINEYFTVISYLKEIKTKILKNL